MTENTFISTSKQHMISISDEILVSSQLRNYKSSEIGSLQSIQNAEYFEQQFEAKCYVILFSLLRQFESENNTTISDSTGREIESIYDKVLLRYGRHIACGHSIV